MPPTLTPTHTDRTIEWLLRIGVAFSFLYPPVSAWLDPYAWVGYFPLFVIDLVPLDEITLLHIFGLAEIAIGIWILVARNVRIPALIAAIALFLIVALNFSQMDVLFRDISIALMALALAARHWLPKDFMHE